MPPRDPELPEGTDHVVQGAAGSSTNSNGNGGRRSGGGSSSGFIATSDGGTEKLVSQVREQVSSLRGKATGRLRGFADDGKGRATGLLDEFSGVIDDAARSVDERLGEDYGQYAHRAADALSAFAGRVRDKSVDDILDDTRSLVRSSPAIAIGLAAVAGFALMRVIKTGLDDVGASGGGKSKRKSSGSGGGASGGA